VNTQRSEVEEGPREHTVGDIKMAPISARAWALYGTIQEWQAGNIDDMGHNEISSDAVTALTDLDIEAHKLVDELLSKGYVCTQYERDTWAVLRHKSQWKYDEQWT
jgi:hypothetical protein